MSGTQTGTKVLSPEALVLSRAQLDEIRGRQPGLEQLSEMWMPAAEAARASMGNSKAESRSEECCSGQHRKLKFHFNFANCHLTMLKDYKFVFFKI